jgi:carbon monoxide dehydrogenase subunit G
VLESTAPSIRRWAQEVEGTPFERILAAAETEVRLEALDGGTRVTLTLRQKLLGLARLGGFLVRGATRKQLDEALRALEALHGP